MGSKGGGGGGVTESRVTQSNLPEYAEPYYREMLTRTGYETAVPYTPYPVSYTHLTLPTSALV